MKNKNKGDIILGVSVSLIAILIIGSLFIFKDKFSSVNNDDSDPVYTLDEVTQINTKNDPVIGDSDAPVTIVEFGDYKCPACGYFSNSIYPELKTDYINTGKVKFIFKNFPFIADDSDRAAVYAEGVYKSLGNDAFWKLHESIYEYQNEIYKNNNSSNEKKDVITKKYLTKVSTKLFGSEKASKLKNILDNKEYEKAVKEDLKDADKSKIEGTPTIFVNGKKVVDALNYETIKGAIEEAQNGENK
ncbi:DsbA family protein [Bacillus mexicanus]|uniref:DsbA family protein n=1 Tax=Bacillus mexicanus TaxID=2834415 RepID=UPI003D253D1D